MERELLSIIKLLKKYRNILLGQKFAIYIDHKRLKMETLIRRKVEIQYMKGDNNIFTNSLSCMKINKVSRKKLKH